MCKRFREKENNENVKEQEKIAGAIQQKDDNNDEDEQNTKMKGVETMQEDGIKVKVVHSSALYHNSHESDCLSRPLGGICRASVGKPFASMPFLFSSSTAGILLSL